MVLSVGGVLRRPRTANWREIATIMNRTGADAVPIVVLINFLIGFVMAFQSAVQLKQFGANIFVADLVGLSITRELGPLMTAIIVCGRSGAAFAAELGHDEGLRGGRRPAHDGLRPAPLPGLSADPRALPGDARPHAARRSRWASWAGSWWASPASTSPSRATSPRRGGALHVWDVFQGLIKCGVFAVAIGLISCQQGLATTGGAEGVGRRTTASVVTALFALILLDAGFTVLFHAFHL